MPPPTGLEICSNRPGKIGLTVSPLSLTLECSSRLGSSSCPWSRWLSPSCCSPGTRTPREDSLPLKKAKVHTLCAFLALDTLESEVERFLFIFRFSFPHSGVLPTTEFCEINIPNSPQLICLNFKSSAGSGNMVLKLQNLTSCCCVKREGISHVVWKFK